MRTISDFCIAGKVQPLPLPITDDLCSREVIRNLSGPGILVLSLTVRIFRFPIFILSRRSGVLFSAQNVIKDSVGTK
jgi:hypothetical protein